MGVTRSSSSFLARRDDLMEVGMEAISDNGFVGLKLLPARLVSTITGAFRYHTAATFTRKPPDITGKSNGRGANERTNIVLASDTYACELRAREFDWSEFEAALYEDEVDFETTATQMKTLEIQREHEARVIAKVTNTSVFTGSTNALAVTNEWDDAANATPIDDLIVGAMAIKKKSGQTPNLLTIGEYTARKLSINNQIRGALGISNNDRLNDRGYLDPSELAKALNIAEVVVAAATYNSAADGLAYSGDTMWNDEYAFLSVSRGGSLAGPPSLGRTFAFDKYAGLLAVDMWEEKGGKLKVVGVEQCTDEKILNTGCGFLFSNIKT
jgi:hypothetical protein